MDIGRDWGILATRSGDGRHGDYVHFAGDRVEILALAIRCQHSRKWRSSERRHCGSSGRSRSVRREQRDDAEAYERQSAIRGPVHVFVKRQWLVRRREFVRWWRLVK